MAKCLELCHHLRLASSIKKKVKSILTLDRLGASTHTDEQDQTIHSVRATNRTTKYTKRARDEQGIPHDHTLLRQRYT